MFLALVSNSCIGFYWSGVHTYIEPLLGEHLGTIPKLLNSYRLCL